MISLNLITYSLYITITVIIIVKVGLICYKNGNIFVLHLIPKDKEFCLRINNLLLTGYYLINIGYAILTLSDWAVINSISQMAESLSGNIGIIVCILAALHYFNLFWITKFIKNIK